MKAATGLMAVRTAHLVRQRRGEGFSHEGCSVCKASRERVMVTQRVDNPSTTKMQVGVELTGRSRYLP